MRLLSGVAVLTVCALALPNEAAASGPVERLVQVLLSPSDANTVVVRWGIASEGFLFSHDGGKNFKAMCSQAITPSAAESDKVKRVSGQNVPSAAATLIDTQGRLVVGQIDGLWTDDGTGGCGWNQQLQGQWPYSLKRDPKSADELIAVVNKTISDAAQMPTGAVTHLMRRAADGVTWTELGALVPVAADQFAYGGDLLASATATGTQLYAGVSIMQGTLSAKQSSVVVGSTDGGKTWSAPFVQPESQEDLTLLAIDPKEPKRILATVYRDSAPDTLMLSEDQGKTFSAYQEIRETSSVSFGPDGRVYISDAGDSTGSDALGGLWTAAKLGDPLSLVANTSLLDCAQYDPSSQKLFACKRDKLGLLDPVSGQFDQLAAIGTIPDQIECPGVDIVAACSTQLNAGASWCCAGHYPFTPFCGEYDVTMRDTQRLYCGLSGRAFDQMSGRGPADAGLGSPDAGTSSDGGVRDAAVAAPDAAAVEPAKQSDGGCAVAPSQPGSSRAGVFMSLSLALAALARSLRRRRHARARFDGAVP